MNAVETNGIALASLVLRIGIGANLLGHGIVRMGSHYGVFREWIQGLFSTTPIPSILVTFMGYLIPNKTCLYYKHWRLNQHPKESTTTIGKTIGKILRRGI